MVLAPPDPGTGGVRHLEAVDAVDGSVGAVGDVAFDACIGQSISESGGGVVAGSFIPGGSVDAVFFVLQPESVFGDLSSRVDTAVTIDEGVGKDIRVAVKAHVVDDPVAFFEVILTPPDPGTGGIRHLEAVNDVDRRTEAAVSDIVFDAGVGEGAFKSIGGIDAGTCVPGGSVDAVFFVLQPEAVLGDLSDRIDAAVAVDEGVG